MSVLDGSNTEIAVEYDELVARYQTSLTTTLRSFRGGASFLEGWVPDPQPGKGILNMLESAAAAGVPSLTIAMGLSTLDALSLPRLVEAAHSLGEVTMAPREGGGTVLCVVFSPREAAGGTTTKLQARAERVRRARDARQARDRARASAADGAGAPGTDLEALYGEAVRRILARAPTHEGTLGPEVGLVLVTATSKATVLSAHVDPATHVLRAACHGGAPSDTWRGLLEGLCTTIEQRPLLEAAYHGVIRLEALLRDRRRPRPVAGIVTPESVAPEFRTLTALVRGLLDDYRQQTGYADMDSRWDPEAGPAWTALSHDERLARLQAVLEELGPPYGYRPGEVRCLRLERLTRVTLMLPPELEPLRKASLLMALEAHLKASLEPTIHVYQDEMHDKNKLRRL